MHSSSRIRNYEFLRLFKCRYGLLPRHARKVFEEVCKRVTAFDVVQKSSEGNAGSHEYWLATENLGINVDHSVAVCHMTILPAWRRARPAA